MRGQRQSAVTYRAAFYWTQNAAGRRLNRAERKALAQVLKELRTGKIEIHALIE
jgi:uncharacterized membrane protein